MDDPAARRPFAVSAFAPRGLARSFTIDIEPTGVLVFSTLAGFEHFAAELCVPADSETPPSDLSIAAPDVLAPVAERYGIQVVGPRTRARQ